jgi:histone H3/H4
MKDNSIIKHNQIIKILNAGGIKRFKKEALREIEKNFINKLKLEIKLMERKLMIEGRKTLTEKDVKSIISAKNKETEVFEI